MRFGRRCSSKRCVTSLHASGALPLSLCRSVRDIHRLGTKTRLACKSKSLQYHFADGGIPTAMLSAPSGGRSVGKLLALPPAPDAQYRSQPQQQSAAPSTQPRSLAALLARPSVQSTRTAEPTAHASQLDHFAVDATADEVCCQRTKLSNRGSAAFVAICRICLQPFVSRLQLCAAYDNLLAHDHRHRCADCLPRLTHEACRQAI